MSSFDLRVSFMYENENNKKKKNPLRHVARDNLSDQIQNNWILDRFNCTVFEMSNVKTVCDWDHTPRGCGNGNMNNFTLFIWYNVQQS